ncbi:MAG: GspH/FimT family pseudopilin [Rhodocyclaceae bacterium]|jgi:MSHA pilin protein MshC|nr:GspH/FimT family pseudopilin [Rhodocyclaceae bacterium]
MVELVTVIIVASIVVAVALPRFVGRDAFDQRGFKDQLLASLRYARQQAITKRREVCVAINPVSPATLTLTFNPSTTPGAVCSSSIFEPGSTTPFVVSAPNGVTLVASATTFRFNGLGQPVPNASVALTVTGTIPIAVAAETGHVN